MECKHLLDVSSEKKIRLIRREEGMGCLGHWSTSLIRLYLHHTPKVARNGVFKVFWERIF